MTNFTHAVSRIESIVNAATQHGVFDGRVITQGTLVIYTLDRLTVIGLCDGNNEARELNLKNDQVVVGERISQYAVESQRVSFTRNEVVYIG